MAAGTFAFYEKWNTMGSIKLNTFSDVILNISLVLIIAGQIIFIVSFAGCIGALRENTTLLKFVSKLLILSLVHILNGRNNNVNPTFLIRVVEQN